MPNLNMNCLNESMEARAEGLRAKWKSNIDAVESVKRSQGKSFSDEQSMKLALLLESADAAYARADRSRTFNLNEATQTSDVAKGMKLHTFDVITGVYPNLIAEDLVSVQPISSKMAQIFFLKYVRGSKRGKLEKGSTLFEQFGTAGYEGRNYTSQEVEAEAHEEWKLSTTTSYETSLDLNPVIPGTVVVTVENVDVTDNGKGVLAGGVYSGTIDYATGRVSLTTASTGSDSTVSVSYEYDLSYAPAESPEINLQITDSFITARPRKLRSLYSMDAAYDIQMSQGIDIAESLLVAAANELRHETDGDIIMDIWKSSTKSVVFTDSYDPATAGITRRDYAMMFCDTIHQACGDIFQDTKRVRGNWVVCGKKAQDLLNIVGAPRFVGSGAQAAGPYFAGTLDGQIKVYFDPFLGENDFLIGYKGDSMIDAGYIYAPYLMFYSTDLIMLDDFMGRRGFATSYGKRMIEPNLYRKGTIATM